MKIRTLKTKALSMCLAVAIIATYSMVALAGDKKITGEILVSGDVTVNGEIVKSGRTIFTSSTITTTDNSTAVVNVSKVGKVKVAPNSTLRVNFDKNGIAGDLLNGKVTSLKTSEDINIKTPSGEIASLENGKSIETSDDDDDDESNGSSWWLWGIVFAGAGAAIIYAASRDNDISLGGGAVTVSRNTP